MRTGLLILALGLAAGCGGDGGGRGIEADPNAAGVFLSRADLDRAVARIAAAQEPFRTNYNVQKGRANSSLTLVAHPWHIDDMSSIRFGWSGDDGDGIDNTLAENVDRLQFETDRIRCLALQSALTGDPAYAAHAVEMLLDWAREHTPVNIYDFHPNFQTATIDGMGPDRPWNFALDAMWQTYGLINVADAYVLLVRNGHAPAVPDNALIRAWILDLVEAVNSSFHAWTRWADAHPNSGSTTRYRSDNHLSWCLAGLLAGAIALDDDALARYVLDGGTWVDRRAGPYANPSHIRDVIDRAIESGTGAENEGRVYEELILRNPPIGYSIFHLWPMALVARMAAIRFGEDLWTFAGQDGGTIRLAFERYAAFVLGERASPRPDQDGDLSGHRWLWELACARWPTERFRQVVESGTRNAYIVQSIGPVTFLVGEPFP